MASTNTELRAHIYAELKTTQKALESGATRSGDTVTRQHLEDLAQMIDMALKFPPVAPAAAPAANPFAGLGLPIQQTESNVCDLCKPLSGE